MIKRTQNIQKDAKCSKVMRKIKEIQEMYKRDANWLKMMRKIKKRQFWNKSP